MNQEEASTQTAQLIEILARFRADLLWDDIVGVLEKVPPEMQNTLNNTYQEALKKASAQLNLSTEELSEKVEELAYQKINGQTFSEKEIKERLKQYGLNKDEASYS